MDCDNHQLDCDNHQLDCDNHPGPTCTSLRDSAWRRALSTLSCGTSHCHVPHSTSSSPQDQSNDGYRFCAYEFHHAGKPAADTILLAIGLPVNDKSCLMVVQQELDKPSPHAMMISCHDVRKTPRYHALATIWRRKETKPCPLILRRSYPTTDCWLSLSS